ncbi:MAG TPA: SsrA-binding protein SmpB [Candidatus Saccharimonadales bacterium]|nr:SsrA-binding protein SmpB [Candidatus Saccharimonadales bacterium]
MASSVLNKKASYNYFLKDHLEAGIVLTGGEVKSARAGSVTLEDSYVRIGNGEAFLVNCYIAPYKYGFDPSSDPRRERKLLLKTEEIERMTVQLASKNLTFVPTKVYTTHNLIKVEIAQAIPKKKTDKRDDLKKKAVARETEEFLRKDKINARKAKD